MFLIDTHTHLYLDDFNKDRDLLIKSAVKKNIKKFFLPNIDSKTIDSLINLTKLYPNKCYPMIGLHPCSVNNDYINELKILESKIEKHKFIAIGEIGFKNGLIEKIAKVIPIKSNEYQTLAKRPHFSLLNCDETMKYLNIEQPYWRDELTKVIQNIASEKNF